MHSSTSLEEGLEPVSRGKVNIDTYIVAVPSGLVLIGRTIHIRIRVHITITITITEIL